MYQSFTTPVSAARALLIVAVVTTICAAVLAGAGLAQRPAQPPARGDLLYSALLRPGELRGFYPITCEAVTHGVQRWAADSSLSTANLVDNGFVAGLREPLLSHKTRAQAVSVVALFASPSGARREIAAEAAGARASAKSFSAFRVVGIPGARGYLVANDSRSRLTVSFSAGHLQYVVRIATAAPGQVDTLREWALAAALAQYRRMQRPS
jgi:hypothetical protein